MINSVIDGIVRAINSEFSEYCIYTEEVLQGLNRPCFFVYCVNPIVKRYVGSRCLRKNVCVVQYFGDTNEKKREYNDITDKLLTCLAYINVNGKPVMGSDVKIEIVDSVLNVKIAYSVWEYGQVDVEKMQDMKMVL